MQAGGENRSVHPSSTGCRASIFFKGMVSDRRESHLAKQKLPQFSPTVILSLSSQGFETTLHYHWGRRDMGKSSHQSLEEALMNRGEHAKG